LYGVLQNITTERRKAATILIQAFTYKDTAEYVLEELNRTEYPTNYSVKEINIDDSTLEEYKIKIKSEIAAKALQKLTTEEIEALGLQK
jgi:hypothetical protein